MAAPPQVVTPNTPLTANSCALLCTTANDMEMLISNAQLLTGSTADTLLGDFLRGTYASSAAVDTAFRNILGEIIIRQISGTASTSARVVVWVAAGPATAPALSILSVFSTDSVYEILIRTSHTVIR